MGSCTTPGRGTAQKQTRVNSLPFLTTKGRFRNTHKCELLLMLLLVMILVHESISQSTEQLTTTTTYPALVEADKTPPTEARALAEGCSQALGHLWVSSTRAMAMPQPTQEEKARPRHPTALLQGGSLLSPAQVQGSLGGH